MRYITLILMLLCATLVGRAQNAFTAADSLGADPSQHHTQVKLLLSANPVRPGDTVWAGFDLKMDPGWHTYWKNPGDSGIATQIKWQLPAGITAGNIQWPLPHKLPPLDVTTYVYTNETMLFVPLTLATNLKAGPLNLSADVSWLECQDQCIPASTTVKATLNVGNQTTATADAQNIGYWKSLVPQPSALPVISWWQPDTNGDTRPFIVGISPAASNGPPYRLVDFYPDAYDNYLVQPATEILTNAPGTAGAYNALFKYVKKYSGDWPTQLSGVLVFENSNQTIGMDVNFPLIPSTATNPPAAAAAAAAATNTHSTPTNTSATTTAATPPPAHTSILLMLLYAFVGGLILNIMPCVLPVIALKILGFVSEAKSDPGRVRTLGLIYALGVLVSFLALAAIAIAFNSITGHRAGWGMQFGNPIFLVCLCTLVTLVALNLFGVFEVVLGGRAFNAAGELASRHGAGGAFFNGVLATTLATPCTAPFLAPALGFAFSQPAAIIILFFLTVGLGLASPYIVLSWHPAWLRLLPKPGLWMEKFKNAMGFPMLATVVWLLYIASATFGRDIAWLAGFLVIVALAAWIFGEFIQRGQRRKGLAAVIALLLLAAGYHLILERQLNWRHPAAIDAATGEAQDTINWQPWSHAAVTQAQTAGHPVLVDFTADWCLTCQVNKKSSIDIPSVRKKLKQLNAVTLVGDYTHFPQNITDELQRYGRAGVPLVLVYPRGNNAAALVLPEVLSPEIVLNALDGIKPKSHPMKDILIGVGIALIVIVLILYLRRQEKPL